MAVKILRKNPHPDFLTPYIKRKGSPPHPVAEAIGPEWFRTEGGGAAHYRAHLWMCVYCSNNDLQVKLSWCSKCRSVRYCSKDCQRADWKQHKPTCQHHVSRGEAFLALKRLDPVAGAKAEALHMFLSISRDPNFAMIQGPINALGLHHDPSRGREYIVISELGSAPDEGLKSSSADYLQRLRIVRCGVFKIADVRQHVMETSQIDLDAHARDTERAFEEQVARSKVRLSWEKLVPYYMLFCGPDYMQGYQWRTNAISVESLSTNRYDRHWRKGMNRDGKEPDSLILPCGALDAEMDFVQ
ncbi:hypothetical protein BXZ70DRAFT_47761 [Cristinia sonorae]|uniref:MYND-type domain-containing protein n=1 Tax=Cristinia sonorae TaxID=1940300 RepID=A0A8K0URY4_9AGAR|nr:hypothetical protein BXZ70DRAFT_47761 [Cristinia sonorae]